MEYYEVIKNPMSLEMVDTKLKNKEYQTLKEVVTDIGQIFNNAKRCELSLLPHTITFYAGSSLIGRQHQTIAPLYIR